MLVHGFILVECIGFKFKLEFEIKLVECCLEKKRGRKTRKGKNPKNQAQNPVSSGQPVTPFFLLTRPDQFSLPRRPNLTLPVRPKLCGPAPLLLPPDPAPSLSPSPRTARSCTARFTAQPHCAWPAPLRHPASAQRPRRTRSSLCHAGPTCRPFRLRHAAPLFAGPAMLLAAPALWATCATSTALQSPLPAPPAAYAF